MKNLIVALVIVLMVAGCGERQLPDGYKLLCSLDGDKYTLGMPNGTKNANTWTSKLKAIEHACFLEENKDERPGQDPYFSWNHNWEECE